VNRWIGLLAGVVLASPAHGFALSGTLTTTGASPVYPCDIDVHDRDTGVLVPTVADSTLPNGSYSIDLPNGRYRVAFKPPPASHQMPVEFPDVKVEGAGVTLSAVLGPAHWIQGRVVDATATGIEAVSIGFHDAAGNTPDNVFDDKSDPDGTFLTAVSPGVWDVDLVPPIATRQVPTRIDGVDLTSGDPDVGTIAVQPGWIVTATVTDLGFFPIFDADLDVRPSAGGPKVFTPRDNTDLTGVATIVLAPGTYDVVASPPVGGAYATRTARAIEVQSDVTLPNFALPPGLALTATCRTPGMAPLPGVDLDVDSLPAMHRLETPGDFSDATGAIQTLVSTGAFRITLSPPVASRLLPIRFDSVAVSGPTSLGTLVFPAGHWVTVQAVAAAGGAPVAGANLDFIRVSSGQLALTLDDVTGPAGQTTVTTDSDLYRLRVIPPDATLDTLVIENFRTLSDTTVVVALGASTVDVAPGGIASHLRLAAPWPQPSRGTVHLAFEVAQGTADLEVLDIAGRRLATLGTGIRAGLHHMTWNGRSKDGGTLPPGVYLVRLSPSAGGASAVRSITLLR